MRLRRSFHIARDLREWHTWSLFYGKDDSYRVYYDGRVVQEGTIHWRLSGNADAEATGLHFLFDFGWGHTGVQEVNIALWSELFPLVYEVDYGRVYLRKLKPEPDLTYGARGRGRRRRRIGLGNSALELFGHTVDHPLHAELVL